jgi:hypothetical protein
MIYLILVGSIPVTAHFKMVIVLGQPVYYIASSNPLCSKVAPFFLPYLAIPFPSNISSVLKYEKFV